MNVLFLLTWYLDFGEYYSALTLSCDAESYSHMGKDAEKKGTFWFLLLHVQRKILHANLNCKTLLWVLCINYSLVIWNNLGLTEKRSFEVTSNSLLLLLNLCFGEWGLLAEKYNQVNEQ